MAIYTQTRDLVHEIHGLGGGGVPLAGLRPLSVWEALGVCLTAVEVGEASITVIVLSSHELASG